MAHTTRLLVVAVMFSAAAACLWAEETGETPPLIIGLLLPPEEAEAVSLRQGVQLGVDHANQSPGPRARIIVRGRAGQWGADGEEAGRLALDDEVTALIAPPGGAPSHLALQVAGRTAVPVVSLCSDSSVVGAGVPWMIRIVPEAIEEAKTLFASAKVSCRAWRWIAFVPEERAGREAADDLAQAAHEAGVSLERPTEVKRGTTDFSTFQKHIPTAWPDGILVWLDPVPAGCLANSLRTAGFRGILAGPGRLQSGEFVTTAGRAAEGFVVPEVVRDELSAAAYRRFEASFCQRFGRKPDATAAMAYDAANLLITVLRKSCGRPPHSLFPPSAAEPGVTGPLAFERSGRRLVSLRLRVCRDGRYCPLEEKGATGKYE